MKYQIRFDDRNRDEGERSYELIVTVRESKLVVEKVTKNWGEAKGGGATYRQEGKTRTIKDIKISKLEE